MLAKVRSTLRALTGRRTLERDMDEEMRFHMEAYEADLVRSGISAREARLRARVEFGGIQEFKDECRDARGLYWPDEFVRNVRYAVRVLRKSPGFTIAAVTTLALCIGANTAIFSVVDAVLFRPLPFPEPDRLMEVVTHIRSPRGESTEDSEDGTTWETLRQGRSFDVAAWSGGMSGVNIATQNRAMYVQQQRITAGYFRIMGVPPATGREFTAVEDRAGGPDAIILSDQIWRNVFAADSAIIGKKVLVRGEPHTIVGVASAKFRSIAPADVWTPLRPTRTGEGGGQNYGILGRLRPGVTWPQAKAEIDTLGPAALQNWHYGPGTILRLDILPLQDSLAAYYRRPLYILLAAVGMVLLIGCVNLTGLMLARSAARSREIATRLALGGGHASVVRQLLTESLVISVFGGIAGIVVGYFAIDALMMAPARFDMWQEIRLDIWQEVKLDGRVLAAALIASISTSVLVGLAPALQAARVDIRSALAEGGSRGIAGCRSHWMRRFLVVAEVALGLVLLVGAGLLVRTLLNLQNLEPGFDGNKVLVASVSLQDARYRTTDAVSALFNRTLEQIRTTPGVESAAAALHVPYERWLNNSSQVVDGASGAGLNVMTSANYVTPGYFETLRIPVRSGRVFDRRDRKGAKLVAIVNEEYVRKYMKGQPAVGNHVRLGMDQLTREIIGVVGNLQQRPAFGNYTGPLAQIPAVFVPLAQIPDSWQIAHVWFTPKWIVRSAVPRDGLIAAMQHAVESADPLLPFATFQTFDSVRDTTLNTQRVFAGLLGSLAALALLLAAVGIYGLIANSVVERTRELGVRMTLGAGITDIIISAAAPGVFLSMAGVAIGSVVAYGAVGVMRSLLYGVKPVDPGTFAAVAAGLLGVAAVASLIPALRLVRLDPASTLRVE